MEQQKKESIEVLLKEGKLYKPNIQFQRKAHINSFSVLQALRRKALKNPEKFWAEAAKELSWAKPWKKVLSWKPPFAQWFTGGKINVAYNCLDRHLEGPRKNKAAIIWEGEPGETRTLTYQQLHHEVCRFANNL